MKNKIIRIIAILLVCLTVPFGNVWGETSGEEAMSLLLSKLSIMQGYPDGELHLDKSVSRAEFSKITIAASPYKNHVALGMNVSPFGDVHYTHWAAPYVKLSVSNGLLKGYPDATFRPDATVLYEEAVTVYLRLLGYTSEDFGYAWPYGQMGLAGNLGLTEGMETSIGTPMTRLDVMRLTYNLMTCLPKNGTRDYIESIQYQLLEDVVLVATHKEDNSVGTNQVYTTAGSFVIGDDFSHDYVGQKGDAVLKNGDELVCFIPYAQSAEQYVVYSKLDNAIVTYQNGTIGQLDVNNNTVAYMGTQKSTYAQIKNSMEMGDVVSVQRDKYNHVEYIIVREGDLIGPVVVRNDDWHRSLSVGNNVTVMRNGIRCSADDVENYDVVYYSPELNMVMAYNKRVTGIYESASPNKDQLTSVSISGVTYQVESAEAFSALSSGGEVAYGDTVTVLLGKDGAIAGVMTADKKDNLIGYFSSAGVKEYTNINGEVYSNYYVEIIGTDGQSFEYAAKRDYRESDSLNRVVRVHFSDGLAYVTGYSGSTISGMVDASKRTIGNRKVAQNVNILDVVQGTTNNAGGYASVFLQRLDGMQLSNSGILYYETNKNGEISDLILNDITGECYAYGLVTEASSRNIGMSVSGSYSYDIGGVSGSITTNGSMFLVSKGQAVQMLMANGRPQNMKALTKLSATVKEVEGDALIGTNGTRYLLSDGVVVYKKKMYDYTIIPLSELMVEDYRITAYHDKSMDRGGRIRIIIAEDR